MNRTLLWLLITSVPLMLAACRGGSEQLALEESVAAYSTAYADRDVADVRGFWSEACQDALDWDAFAVVMRISNGRQISSEGVGGRSGPSDRWIREGDRWVLTGCGY
jgi:hypothetical protein